MEHDEQRFAFERRQMVEQQLAGRDISEARVLAALGRVPRHLFVPDAERAEAYADHPLAIGYGQTISQPYIVALMTQLAGVRPQDRVLDVGTGCGYQAAVLAELCDEVYSIEIIEPLAAAARQRLDELGYANIHTRQGDGYQGWPEAAPFNAILVAAAPDHVPRSLVEQLAPEGRLLIPVGESWQRLLMIEKDRSGEVHHLEMGAVAFVPMTGAAQEHAARQ